MAIVNRINTRGTHIGQLKDLVQRGLSAVVSPQAFRGQEVLIKVNLCGRGACNRLYSMTDPRLIATLAQVAHENGAMAVTVADHSADYMENPGKFFEALGIQRLADENGFTFVDLREYPFERVGDLTISRIIDGQGIILNTTIPKTHHQAVFSGCAKSLAMGLTSDRRNMHDSGKLAEAIVKVNARIAEGRTLVHILDGRYGQEGLGPHFGDPVEPGFMLFGTDAIAVDAVGARLVGLDPNEIPVLAHAARTDTEKLHPEETGDDVAGIRMVRSPNWHFAPYANLVFIIWLETPTLAKARLYAIDEESQGYAKASANRELTFEEPITDEELQKWFFKEGGALSVFDADILRAFTA